jgi:1-acyl-sn-glycerol-3-phosphate acyltransferase
MGFSYWVAWSLARLIFATGFRWRVYDRERVPLEGPVILAANHASFLDPPLVGAGLPRAISYLARHNLFKYPGIGWLLRSWNAVPVDRDGGGGAGLKAILNRLLAGGGIILFPEGTRSPDGKLRAPQSGIGLTVIKSKAPVVPVRVFGTHEAWGRHMKLPRRRPVAVRYGQVMHFEALRAEAETCGKSRLKEIYQEVAEQIMREIALLEPPGNHSRTGHGAAAAPALFL